MNAHVPRRLGHRGAVLLIFGVLWLAYGWSLWTAPLPHRPILLLSGRVWTFIWALGGAIAITYAWRRRRGADWLGYAASLFPPAAWASGYVWLVIRGDGARSGINALIWTAVTGLILICADWNEEPDLVHREDRHGR